MPFCDKKKYKYLFKVAVQLIPALSGSPCTVRISLWRRGKQSICEMKWMCNFGFRCDIDFLVSCWLFSFQFCYYCSQVLSVHCECKTLKPPHSPILGARVARDFALQSQKQTLMEGGQRGSWVFIWEERLCNVSLETHTPFVFVSVWSV